MPTCWELGSVDQVKSSQNQAMLVLQYIHSLMSQKPTHGLSARDPGCDAQQSFGVLGMPPVPNVPCATACDLGNSPPEIVPKTETETEAHLNEGQYGVHN